MPWRGAYPIGLTHMIGGLSAAATGSLRALLDSAHIQNIPTLLKLKGGPNGQPVKLGRQPISSKVLEAVWGFFSVYLMVFVLMMSKIRRI